MDSYSQELNPNTNPLSSRNSHNTTRTSPPSPRHDQALRPRRSLRPRLRRDLCEGRRMLRLEEGRVHVRRRCRFLQLGPERSRNRRNRSGTRSGRCCCTPGELDGCSPTCAPLGLSEEESVGMLPARPASSPPSRSSSPSTALPPPIPSVESSSDPSGQSAHPQCYFRPPTTGWFAFSAPPSIAVHLSPQTLDPGSHNVRWTNDLAFKEPRNSRRR
ncbi:hypothetical protein DFP72DRAFT_293411 [Ephemerocybe angulata]|uniref:Uncharacterized protein n=1 Tax=Ephemerocybe angulata TaxID=980116 RepID=A0A8H6I195_9AGAR|nr:hypothetical protein DFP72DRAFT_293411 [Tulosesus angulatus]